jgi:hypothetical protein
MGRAIRERYGREAVAPTYDWCSAPRPRVLDHVLWTCADWHDIWHGNQGHGQKGLLVNL